MRQMTIDQFHEVIMLYIIDIASNTDYDFDDPETIVFSEEFDDFIRHLKKRPLGKMRLQPTYVREDALTRLLFKQLRDKTDQKEYIRIL